MKMGYLTNLLFKIVLRNFIKSVGSEGTVVMGYDNGTEYEVLLTWRQKSDD